MSLNNLDEVSLSNILHHVILVINTAFRKLPLFPGREISYFQWRRLLHILGSTLCSCSALRLHFAGNVHICLTYGKSTKRSKLPLS